MAPRVVLEWVRDSFAHSLRIHQGWLVVERSTGEIERTTTKYNFARHGGTMTVHAIDRKMLAAGDDTNPDSPSLTFLDFWRAYPRKVAKVDAEKAWVRIQPSEYPKILAAIERHKHADQWTRDNGRFIVYPATYLNGKRWEDELDGAPTMGQCVWNQNGTREEGQPRCTQPGAIEKRGLVYCKTHAERA